MGDVSFIGQCPSGTSGTAQFGRCYQDCQSGYTTGNLGDISRICYQDCSCGTELFGASLCSPQVDTPFGPVCDAFQAYSRGWYDRTVDLTCPAGSSVVATTCWGDCAAGWQLGTTGDVMGRSSALNCYMSTCPPDFPTMCLSGLTQVCVKAGVSCSSPQVRASPSWFVQRSEHALRLSSEQHQAPGSRFLAPLSARSQVFGALWGMCSASSSSSSSASSSVSTSVSTGAWVGGTQTGPAWSPTMGCPAGYALIPNALVCGPCAAGRWCPGGLSTSPCPINHYCPANNTVTPTPCPASAPFSPAGSTSADQCTVCSPGAYVDSATMTCQACPAGAWCPGVDGSIHQCNSGYYCPAASSQMTACPQYAATGQFQVSLPGAWDVSNCTACPSGTIFSADPMPASWPPTGDMNATCAPVAPGVYTTTGSVNSSPCPPGMYCAPSVPALGCQNGTWSVQGSADASACYTPTCPAGQ